MSSRHKASKKGRDYPTRWSSWEWSDNYKCYFRYRVGESGAHEYEYEYGPVQAANDPRTVPTMGSIPPPLQQTQYTSSVGYTTAPEASVDNITQGLSQATLGSGPSQQFPQSYAQSTQKEPNYIITTRNPNTTSEKFDPHYKVHRGREFKLGRIFKVLWTEPNGNDGYDSNCRSNAEATISVRNGRNGETFHEKVRRFVIIKSMHGHCICLPITTYGGEGVNKRGVDASHHTIIYSSETAVAFNGEKGKGLTRNPIRVEPISHRHKLDSASRLNYAKPYTVEYNVKVWFIGKVYPSSEWQLEADYNAFHPNLKSREMLPHVQSTTGAVDHAQGGGYSAECYPSGMYDSGPSYSSATPYTTATPYSTATPYTTGTPYSTATSYSTATPYNVASSMYKADQGSYDLYRSGYPSLYPSVLPLDTLVEHKHGDVNKGTISCREGDRYRERHGYGDNEAHERIYDEPHEGGHDEPESPAGSEEPTRPRGDPLHDPDSDDNGDQGDQDRGGGQRTFQRYSRGSELRR